MPEITNENVDDIQQRLAAPFPSWEVQTRIMNKSQFNANEATAAFYIDARAIMDRLDAVVGVGNWYDHYEVGAFDSKVVVCTIFIKINGEWIGKSDTAGEAAKKSGQGERSGTDPYKTAFSNALKRAAVKWGIGRYLYALGAHYKGVYFAVKGQNFVNPIPIPNEFLPEEERVSEKPAPSRPDLPVDLDRSKKMHDYYVAQLDKAETEDEVNAIRKDYQTRSAESPASADHDAAIRMAYRKAKIRIAEAAELAALPYDD